MQTRPARASGACSDPSQQHHCSSERRVRQLFGFRRPARLILSGMKGPQVIPSSLWREKRAGATSPPASLVAGGPTPRLARFLPGLDLPELAFLLYPTLQRPPSPSPSLPSPFRLRTPTLPHTNQPSPSPPTNQTSARHDGLPPTQAYDGRHACYGAPLLFVFLSRSRSDDVRSPRSAIGPPQERADPPFNVRAVRYASSPVLQISRRHIHDRYPFISVPHSWPPFSTEASSSLFGRRGLWPRFVVVALELASCRPKRCLSLSCPGAGLMTVDRFDSTLQFARSPTFRLDDVHDLSLGEVRERAMAKFAAMVHYVTTESVETFQERMTLLGTADPGAFLSTRYSASTEIQLTSTSHRFLDTIRSSLRPVPWGSPRRRDARPVRLRSLWPFARMSCGSGC